jgi:hypothetical protein
MRIAYARPAKQARRTKSRIPNANAPNAGYAYDGAGYLGTVVEAGGEHFAFDADGRPLGHFPNRIAAVRALPGVRESDAAALYVGCGPFIPFEALQ